METSPAAANVTPVASPDGLIDALPAAQPIVVASEQVEQPLINGMPGGMTTEAGTTVADLPTTELIVGPPGTVPEEVPAAPSRIISVGPTSNLSMPILGLPKDMSLAQGNVLARQQNEAAAAPGGAPNTTAWAYPEAPSNTANTAS